MPGCTEKAYVQLEPMLQAISAKAGENGKEPCVTYIGTDGAGHYVKMVHNGIEYADMQLGAGHGAGRDGEGLGRMEQRGAFFLFS